jgi:hypothetical protein
MIQRWAFVSLVSLAVACTDSTAPSGRLADPPLLSAREYAWQLRGDPLLANVSKMLGRPEVMRDIDASVGAVSQISAGSHDAGTLAITTARLSVLSAFSQDTLQTLTENDVLAAVLTATLDRIAQVNGDSAASASEPDPPPSR